MLREMRGWTAAVVLVAAASVTWNAVAATTARAEIRRGWDAGGKCATAHADAYSATVACVQTEQDQNRAKMPDDYRYFDIGLYFKAWLHFNTLAGAAATDGDIRAGEKTCWTNYVVARREVGLADSSVVEAVDAGVAVKSRIAVAEKRYGN